MVDYKCPICGKDAIPPGPDIRYIKHKGKPALVTYVHESCYRSITKGGKANGD